MIQNNFPSGTAVVPYGEWDLDQYARSVTATDANGIPTEIQFKRSDNSLFMKRTYSNPISAGYNTGLYQTCVEIFYATNGVTVLETHTYAFTFTAIGVLASASRTVT